MNVSPFTCFCTSDGRQPLIKRPTATGREYTGAADHRLRYRVSRKIRRWPAAALGVNHISMKTVWDNPHVYPDPSVILHDEKQPQRRGERRGKGAIAFSATSAPLRCRLSPERE